MHREIYTAQKETSQLWLITYGLIGIYTSGAQEKSMFYDINDHVNSAVFGINEIKSKKRVNKDCVVSVIG